MADWDLPTDPLAALAAGDPTPFEDFVRRHARTFYAFFRRQGAGVHRAEDLTQEVFLKLHEHAARYRPQERFSAYCFRVARNVWIDERRRRGVRPRGATLDTGLDVAGEADDWRPGPAPAPDPRDTAVLGEESGRVLAALDELGEGHRDVFVLGVVEELPYGEIAERLGIPKGTVKSRMFHAVRRLKEILEPSPTEASREEGAR